HGLEPGGCLWRVQGKSTHRYRKGGYLGGACHFSAGGTKQAYTPEQIDFLVVCIVPRMRGMSFLSRLSCRASGCRFTRRTRAARDDTNIFSCTAWKRPREDGSFAGEGARATQSFFGQRLAC